MLDAMEARGEGLRWISSETQGSQKELIWHHVKFVEATFKDPPKKNMPLNDTISSDGCHAHKSSHFHWKGCLIDLRIADKMTYIPEK